MRLALLPLVASVGTLAACTHPSPNFEVEFISTPSPSPVFSPAVRVGNLLFLSGQIGTDTANRLVPGGLQAEARQALNNIKRVLEQNGSSLDRVDKCTVFLSDMR
jgi:enamine deaminase RidA (YjgF/YER057c/UK114 family)